MTSDLHCLQIDSSEKEANLQGKYLPRFKLLCFVKTLVVQRVGHGQKCSDFVFQQAGTLVPHLQ